MKIKTATAAVSAALLSLIAAGQAGAAQIYPVDQARFMTNARFDFKIELDKSVARKDVTVQINGADYSKTLSGKEVWMEKGGQRPRFRPRRPRRRDQEARPLRSHRQEPRRRNARQLGHLHDARKAGCQERHHSSCRRPLLLGHRTAARILSKGVTNGMYNAPLAMDDMPHMALLGTSSVDTIAADSANTASAYMTGHKSSVNALGVYADRTQASQDDPKQETIAELLRRKTNKAIGVVSDAEIEDATPASVVSHTRRRADKADIVGMFYNVKPEVILGGGSAYFLPKETAGSKRKDSINYIQKFGDAGYKLVTDRTEMLSAVSGQTPDRLLGLFHTGNMDGWVDRHQWKGNTVKKFPNQPDLTESFDAAVKVLEKNKDGFFLMLEAGLVDKYSHPLDWTRSVGDTIAFDKVVERAKAYCAKNPDTLLIVTGDHTHSISVAGTVDDNKPGKDMREKVGVYADAGYPNYEDKDKDGFPDNFQPSKRLAVFFGAHPDYYETYRSYPDATFNPAVKNEKGEYVADARYKDVEGGHFVEGNLPRNGKPGRAHGRRSGRDRPGSERRTDPRLHELHGSLPRDGRSACPRQVTVTRPLAGPRAGGAAPTGVRLRPFQFSETRRHPSCSAANSSNAFLGPRSLWPSLHSPPSQNSGLRRCTRATPSSAFSSPKSSSRSRASGSASAASWLRRSRPKPPSSSSRRSP